MSLEITDAAGMHFRLVDGHKEENGMDGGAVKDHIPFGKYPLLPHPFFIRASPPPTGVGLGP